MKKISTLIIALLLIVPSAMAQVNVNVGDIPAGQQVIITYDVTVNEDLPQGLQFVSNQGTASGNGFVVLSDDPDTLAVSDETRTAVGLTIAVGELPATGEGFWLYNLLLSAIVAVVGTALIGGGYMAWQRR